MMKKTFGPIKTTIIGGVVFLVPLVIVAAIVGKAYQLMKVVAEPVDKLIPLPDIGGIALVNILAIIAILIVCFFAGLAARSIFGTKIRESLNSILLNVIPGYAFVHGITDSIASSVKASEGFSPVIVRMDDYAQIGFEVERLPGNMVAVYLPGAPNPWSGAVAYIEENRVKSLDMTVASALKNIQKLGRGSGNLSVYLKNT